MNILVDDGMQIKVGTGIGKYSLYLYNTLKKLNDVLVDIHMYDCNMRSKLLCRLRYLLYINSKDYIKMTEKYNIIHYTNYAIPYRRNNKSKYVVTIHDLAAFKYPYTLSKIYGIYNRFFIKYALKHADYILTVSESVKYEIITKWPQYAAKVNYIYPGVYTEFIANKFDESKDYENVKLINCIQKKQFFLFIGTIEKRKNVRFIIEAFLKLKEYPVAQNYKLVLAGRPGFGYNEFIKIVGKSKFAKDIIFTGYISTNDCQKLYRDAAAYLFPSIYEGFGSTQLECMIYRLPIILSNISTNIEVSSGYGFYFNLGDLDSLVTQMLKICSLEYSQEELNLVAEKNLKKYDWNILVEEYLETYRKAIQDKNLSCS